MWSIHTFPMMVFWQTLAVFVTFGIALTAVGFWVAKQPVTDDDEKSTGGNIRTMRNPYRVMLQQRRARTFHH